MSALSGGKGLLIAALVLGLAAAGAMVFVMIEPIMAYDRLPSLFDGPMLGELMASRMREAAIPTAAGVATGLLSVLLALAGGPGSKGLFIAAVSFSAEPSLDALTVEEVGVRIAQGTLRAGS